ncbi:MAG TPA: Hsp70 family protein, partial [Tepidisphaeraceae bacterium]
EVTFNIDVNGILNVTAKDKGTNKEAKVTIQNSGGLSKEEIEKMKREAEAHADEDKKRRELVDAKNRGESLAFSAERSLKEHGEKVPAEVRVEIERNVSELRDALKTDDGDVINKKIEILNESVMKMGEAVYKDVNAAGADQTAPEAQSNRGTTGGAKKDDDVIDAEYEVKE